MRLGTRLGDLSPAPNIFWRLFVRIERAVMAWPFCLSALGGATYVLNSFRGMTSGHREIERVHPLLGDSALSYNPISIGGMIVSSLFHPEDPSSMHLRPTHALGTKKEWRSTSPPD